MALPWNPVFQSMKGVISPMHSDRLENVLVKVPAAVAGQLEAANLPEKVGSFSQAGIQCSMFRSE